MKPAPSPRPRSWTSRSDTMPPLALGLVRAHLGSYHWFFFLQIRSCATPCMSSSAFSHTACGTIPLLHTPGRCGMRVCISLPVRRSTSTWSSPSTTSPPRKKLIASRSPRISARASTMPTVECSVGSAKATRTWPLQSRMEPPMLARPDPS
ncbi:uncharacterized protein LOC119351918 [Triticum dicoccoides]|uniref:uncharacterized protein LOC119351918 n=1 Tax=Triticum dicoccoides TaxID=85692 RepID=UPI00188FC26A|nr:uncharacterized protein LOC119351918 [Triticum dicoccoides]